MVPEKGAKSLDPPLDKSAVFIPFESFCFREFSADSSNGPNYI